MKRITVVMGTRPEAIKLCPLILELQKRKGIALSVCATGQHKSMLDGALEAFGVVADVRFDVMKVGKSVSEVTAEILSLCDQLFVQDRPDLLLVQGDTATAFAAALAAFYRRIPIGHVEAGLRTYHMQSPFPEELHREAISMMADFHFAPTAAAKNNLINEGKPEKTVFLTGNTVVDALRFSLCIGKPTESVPISKDHRVVLFTAHRRENLGEPLKGMLRALRRIVEDTPDVQAICPLHRNPEVRNAAAEILDGCERIRVIEPPETVSFHRLLARSYLVLTDSGGIQEETTALGIPTLVMRYSTERSEGIRAGCLKLVGSGESGIVSTAKRLLESGNAEYLAMRHPSRVFGDGRASIRIANILERMLREA